MTKIEYGDAARQDLNAIADYYAAQYPGRAEKVAAEIAATCEKLVRNPEIGRARPEFAEKDLRSMPTRHGKHVVFYRKTEEGVEIVRVLHSSQDHELQLAQQKQQQRNVEQARKLDR